MRDKPLPRDQYSAIYQIVEEIASSMGARKIHKIVIDGEFNASIAKIGLGTKRVIRLGLPLLSILNEQEFVALVSHELGHSMNGDLNRSVFVGTAINSLGTWHEFIKPSRLYESELPFFFALGKVPFNILLLFIAQLLYFYLYLVSHLNWYDSQRAEYLADQYAARIAGQEAKLALLNKLHLGSHYQTCILKKINNRDSKPLLEEFQCQAAAIPDQELERIRRASLRSDSRLDATHPPTANRIAFIQSLEANVPGYGLASMQYERILQEIAPLKPSIETKIAEVYKSDALGW